MKTTKLSKDFTNGNIARQLFTLMIPFMLSNALQVLYSTIDMIIVGKYVGTAGLSAVSQSSSILNFATMVCLGFANGGQVLIAQALGADKKKETNSIIGTLFTVILSMGVIFSVVIVLLKNLIIKVMNIPPESVGNIKIPHSRSKYKPRPALRPEPRPDILVASTRKGYDHV